MRSSPILKVALLVGLCGCASARLEYEQSPRTVTLRTEPSGATVMQILPFGLAPVDLGTTPLVEKEVPVLTRANLKGAAVAHQDEALRHTGNLVVLIRKEGYEPRRAVLPTDPDETLEHTIRLTPKE